MTPIRLEDSLNDINLVKEIFSKTVVKYDFLSTFLGSYIGGGIHRMVFEYNLDPTKVVKIEIDNTGSNNNEFEVWNEVRWYTGKLSYVPRWFAPCHWISPCGRIMLQSKTKPYVENEKYKPDKIPAFLTDLKPDNFGYIGKQLVCHDYPMVVCNLKLGWRSADHISFS